MSRNGGDLARFEPASVEESGWTPLFVDTNVLAAYFYRQASRHEEARIVVDAIGGGELPYYPLLTNQYVLDEVVSLLLSHASTPQPAHAALDRILAEETFRVLDVESGLVARAVEQFRKYDDHEISLTDHVIAEQARDYDVDHLLTYDGDFRTLGFTVVPHDT